MSLNMMFFLRIPLRTRVLAFCVMTRYVRHALMQFQTTKGFSRAKVLVLVPTRHFALEFIKNMLLLMPRVRAVYICACHGDS